MANLYEKYILPKLIDTACAQPPMTELRGRYVSQATGDVLEIGIGSGLFMACGTRNGAKIGHRVAASFQADEWEGSSIGRPASFQSTLPAS